MSDLGPAVNITDKEFCDISTIIYDKFGIHLPEAKKALVSTRLQKVLKEQGHSSFSEYYNYLKRDQSGEALNRLINRISTNFTYFYREPSHFELLQKKVLPQLEKKHIKNKTLRVWCAGCSTGEEAYTLSILLQCHFDANYNNWDAGLLATDISERALNHAIKGEYNREAISKLPPHLIHSFEATTGNMVRPQQKIRDDITFRRFNLMNDHFPFKCRFDIIFCRNVMIYFDSETRYNLVRRFYNQLNPGGYLFIGHSESISRNHTGFKYIQPSVYQREERDS